MAKDSTRLSQLGEAFLPVRHMLVVEGFSTVYAQTMDAVDDHVVFLVTNQTRFDVVLTRMLIIDAVRLPR